MTPAEYHDGTKHHFNRFAPSLGYLDWACQPSPFRRFADAPVFPLYPDPAAGAAYLPVPATFDRLFDDPLDPVPATAAALGDVLRHALGLSAWKQFRESRWALRVNPSSGNLHPTEAYVVAGPLPGLCDTAAVYHYAADRHAVELRARLDTALWSAWWSEGAAGWLIGLTSIHWREAWKYGERAFRYCQHDLGHAIAAVRMAAGLLGWTARVLPEWSHAEIAMLLGIDRDADFEDAEPEQVGCLLMLAPGGPPLGEPGVLVRACGGAAWSGRASQLSEDHVQWTFIDQVAAATVDPGHVPDPSSASSVTRPSASGRVSPDRQIPARGLILQRRSALDFDGRTPLDAVSWQRMLGRLMPSAGAPWDALWWTPRVHLALFVHLVDGLDPGLYLLPRHPEAERTLRGALDQRFLFERLGNDSPLVCLQRGDYRAVARRLSCDQDIASDGFFSLGMLAEFEGSIEAYGPSFYRQLFWEAGVVGQVLYLEAEAAGARATGIGCFYDDAVHELLGLRGHQFQSLYHFTVGAPVDDRRLTSLPGYSWEG